MIPTWPELRERALKLDLKFSTLRGNGGVCVYTAYCHGERHLFDIIGNDNVLSTSEAERITRAALDGALREAAKIIAEWRQGKERDE